MNNYRVLLDGIEDNNVLNDLMIIFKDASVIDLLVSYNIVGINLYKFFVYGCGKDYSKLAYTIGLLKEEVFSRELVELNLSLDKPVLFIESSIDELQLVNNESLINGEERYLKLIKSIVNDLEVNIRKSEKYDE